MKDIKRTLSILLIIISVYTIYYFQDNIVGFVESPRHFISSLIQNTREAPDQSKDKSEELEDVKVVVVDEEDAVIKVVEESSPAVVSIVRKEVFFDPFRGPFRSEDSIATGFVIDGKEGIVLTNRHVVDSDAATYSVVFGDGEDSYDVEKIYRDPINDFAILKVDLKGKVVPELTLGDSAKLKVGQTVVAIGNALGQFGNSITKGIVSGLGRGIMASTGPFGPVESLDDVIQTDAALNPGNSGGPLLNLRGKVIGINVAISQGAENIGFAIPINALKPVIEDFQLKGKISRPFLGVEYSQITKGVAEERALPVGAFVRKVVPNSPADKAGIKAGDIILKIGGTRLDDESNTLAKIISRRKVGEEIEVVVDRNGKEITLKATLEDLER